MVAASTFKKRMAEEPAPGMMPDGTLNFVDDPEKRVGDHSSLVDAINGRTRTIVLVRHGETAMNRQDKVRGWDEVPLSAQGRTTATQTASELAEDPPDHVVSSDLKRAAQTARIVGEATGATVTTTPLLRTWNVGDLTGTNSTDSDPKLEEYARNSSQQVPGGESYDDFRRRVFTGVSEVLRDTEPTDKVALVTHHRVEQLLRSWIAAGCPADGGVDRRTFDDKTIRPGTAEEMEIDPGKVADVVHTICGGDDDDSGDQ